MPHAAALQLDPPAAEAAPASRKTLEDRFVAAGFGQDEVRASRRRVALAIAASPTAGNVARRSAEVHAELRRVLGSDIPPRS